MISSMSLQWFIMVRFVCTGQQREIRVRGPGRQTINKSQKLNGSFIMSQAEYVTKFIPAIDSNFRHTVQTKIILLQVILHRIDF